MTPEPLSTKREPSRWTRLLRIVWIRGVAALVGLFGHRQVPAVATVPEIDYLAPDEPTIRLERRHYIRPWYWPFEGRRILTVRALQVALFFLLFGVAIRILVSVTLGLSDDEAWYWAISKKLDLSYVVHPPLSVWLVRLTSAMFGDTNLGVRFSSIVCAALGCFWLCRLAVRMGWARGVDLLAILCLTTPLFFLGGILTGPDLPLFACWAGLMDATYAIGAGLEKRRRVWWKVGILCGLALLSKYTGILAVAAAGIWFLASPHGRKQLLTPWPWLSLVFAAVLFSPVIYWNMQHDWASFRFQFLDRHSGSELNFRRWGVFWISQLALYGPPIVWGWFLAIRDAFFPSREIRALPLDKRLPLRFIGIWALVPALVFFFQPLRSEFKIHWALFAFIPVLVYFARFAALRTRRSLTRAAVLTGAWITLIGMTAFYLPVVAAVSSSGGRAPDPKVDISNDFYGWRELPRHLDSIRAAFGDAASLPIVSTRPMSAAQTAFALGSTRGVTILPNNRYETRDWPDGSSYGAAFGGAALGGTALGGTALGGSALGGSAFCRAAAAVFPPRFIYVSDNRYRDPPGDAYPTHTCTSLPTLSSTRLGFPAKEIFLDLCVKK